MNGNVLNQIYSGNPITRTNRKRYSHGTVVSFSGGEVEVDVGARLPDGTPQNIIVPAASGFKPTSGQSVTLIYANDSVHSVYAAAVGESSSSPPSIASHGLFDHSNTTTYIGQPVLASSDVVFNGQKLKGPIVDATHPVFGATGDGTTDDTAAIQAALDFAEGGTVLLPAGTYKTIATLNMSDSGSSLIGVGRLKSIILNKNVAGTHIITTAATIRGCTISNLKIKGHASGGDGIHLTSGFGHVRVINVYFESIGGDAIDGVEANAIDIYCESVKITTGYGYGFNFGVAGASVPINTLHLANCYANDCVEDGFYITNVAAALLNGCAADNCDKYGYRMAGQVQLNGCTAENNTQVGFGIVGSGCATLIGCKTTNQTASYSIVGASKATIIGCTATTAIGAIISLGAGATGGVTVENCNFSGNPTINAAAFYTEHKYAFTTWNPASIASGAYGTTTITVTGARVGDTCAVGFSSITAAGWIISGSVTANDTVTVTLLNMTGSAVDLASGTLRADVWKHS